MGGSRTRLMRSAARLWAATASIRGKLSGGRGAAWAMKTAAIFACAVANRRTLVEAGRVRAARSPAMMAAVRSVMPRISLQRVGALAQQGLHAGGIVVADGVRED